MERYSDKAAEEWRCGHYFYFYSTKGREPDGKVETASMTKTTALYC